MIPSCLPGKLVTRTPAPTSSNHSAHACPGAAVTRQHRLGLRAQGVYGLPGLGSEVQSRGVVRVMLPLRLQGGSSCRLLPLPAPGGSRHPLACAHITPVSSPSPHGLFPESVSHRTLVIGFRAHLDDPVSYTRKDPFSTSAVSAGAGPCAEQPTAARETAAGSRVGPAAGGGQGSRQQAFLLARIYSSEALSAGKWKPKLLSAFVGSYRKSTVETCCFVK